MVKRPGDSTFLTSASARPRSSVINCSKLRPAATRLSASSRNSLCGGRRIMVSSARRIAAEPSAPVVTCAFERSTSPARSGTACPACIRFTAPLTDTTRASTGSRRSIASGICSALPGLRARACVSVKRLWRCTFR